MGGCDLNQPVRALFVGDSTLLIRCADVFVSAGHSIAGVVTKDRRVSEWAKEHGHTLIAKPAGYEQAAAAIEFDYLFSIANLDMLDAALIARARVTSLNFHDGPLPAYAGLNAPVWALLDGVRSYGVTWHEMTETPDAGRIAASADVEISPFETAFSLNTKCYEAGLACFEEIVRRIAEGELTLREQSGQRTYFGRTRRPSAAATIDFTQGAEQIASLIRALQFGPYANPLGAPKLFIGGRLFCVSSADVLDTRAEAHPGCVIESSSDSVVIATGTRLLRLGGLRACDGESDPALEIRPGMCASFPTGELVGRIDALNREAARSEPYWLQNWSSAQSAPLPYPSAEASSEPGFHRFPLPEANSEKCIAAIAAWLGSICDLQRPALLYRSAAHDLRLGDAAPWFNPWRPLQIEVSPDARVKDLNTAAAAAHTQAEAAGPIACDFRHRYAVGDVDLPIPAVAVYEGKEAPEPPPSASVLVCANPQTGAAEALIRRAHFDAATAALMAEHLASAIAADSKSALCAVELDAPSRRAALKKLNTGPAIEPRGVRVFDEISEQARKAPERIAVQTRNRTVTYAELDARIARAAANLAAIGVGKGDIVGVLLDRGPDLVVALLAVMKAGAAYLPLDPTHPPARNEAILEDAEARWLITDRNAPHLSGTRRISLADLDSASAGTSELPSVTEDQLAYLIYTSGSTGKPKGVMIAHRALENFFAAMDERIPHVEGGVWLSVTSPAFDISALELFWTLRRGYTVAIHVGAMKSARRSPTLSLFYFAASAGDGDTYRLLLDGAKFADANGFEAVWTPERHFHEFGGPYPNPAITSAAVAGITKNVHVRAGSCVLPLHDPIRVAEDWALIDNISGGRVGMACASGWNANDFSLAPNAYKERKQVMLDHLKEVRRLWRGEAVDRTDGAGAPTQITTLPRPVQRDLPIWLTAAKSPETFEIAGELGCNVLTHLLGMTFEEVGANIARYRAAWRRAGHPGEGRVTIMLHTFVAATDDDAREIVREPMKNYLRSAVDLVRTAAWTFPTIQQRALREGKTPAEVLEAEPLTADELDAVLDHAFERYFETSGLFGAPERCVEIVNKAAEIGVDEIACLIDFGVDANTALSHLPLLKAVMDRASQSERLTHFTAAADVAHFGATHLQCTPSMATMIAAEAAETGALSNLKALMVGGEALSVSLARTLQELAPHARLMNMYGPTETTIWSTTCALEEIGDVTPLGEPIANTVLRIAGPDGRERPTLVPGELLIGGQGLAEGYWRRTDLTAERFVVNGERFYRTGDLVRRRLDGALEFMGRLDHQVKVRGHRIELGEIEARLCAHPTISQAAVVARSSASGDAELAAYFTTTDAGDVSVEELREHLAQRLPAAMMPATFTRLASMPMTPNGKIDRRALPPPELDRAGAPEPDLVGLEKTIAAIWSELLNRERIGPTQNFFDLGGHSLLAVQLQRRLRAELPMQPVSITDIFQFPTVRGLATFLGGGVKAEEPAQSGTLRGRARLAARQRVRE